MSDGNGKNPPLSIPQSTLWPMFTLMAFALSMVVGVFGGKCLKKCVVVVFCFYE